MDLGLQNKVALVACASKGLGKAVALGLAREGANVAIFSHNQERIEAAAKEIRDATGAQVLAIVADVMRADDLQRAVDETVKKFGTIHILVTNGAGGPPPGAFVALTQEQWRSNLDMMLMMPIRLSQAVVPFMRKQKWGRIIHLASHSVKHPIDNLILSNAIRPAVVALAKTQSVELAKEGILVNSVAPGWTETKRVEEILRSRSQRNQTDIREEYALVEHEIPVGRLARPEELANVVVFLASERASFVNGVCLQVDGGETRTPF